MRADRAIRLYPTRAGGSVNSKKEPMEHRREIDGLRAIAVLSVVLFHGKAAWCPGGFAGVDVFFVISGFLITTIIADQIQSGAFSLLAFYERRVRRILPALFVVNAACLLIGWHWLLPSELQTLAQCSVALMGFASNVCFWQKADYFAPGTATDPLVHTWTLSLEEQFYFLLPLLLLAMRGRGRRAQTSVVGAIVVLSWLSIPYVTQWSHSASFFLLPTRAWELATGSLLALMLAGRPRPASSAGAGAGVALICLSFVLFDEHTPWPGSATILPVLGTTLVLACASPGTRVGRVLGIGGLVAIGRISYSVYLWHQPLFAFARVRLLESYSDTTSLAMVAASLLMGALSWWLVEEPIRRARSLGRAHVFGGAAAASLAIILFGLRGHYTEGWPSRLEAEVAAQAAWTEWSQRIHDPETGNPLVPNAARCWDNFPHVRDSISLCSWGQLGKPVVAVWGDSHSRPIAWELARATSATARIQQMSHNACPPVPGIALRGQRSACNDFGDEALSYLRSTASVETVIVAARWSDVASGRVHFTPLGSSSGIGRSEQIRRVQEQTRTTVRQLLDAGRQVVLVRTVPIFEQEVPRRVARMLMFGGVSVDRFVPYSIPEEQYRSALRDEAAMFDALPDHPQLLQVHPEAVFCNTFLKGRCAAQLEKRPLYIDEHHLSTFGARLLVAHILEQLREFWGENHASL
jgi:peptidoglycan/LPS O-acetylase OafA/YrhL